MTDTNEIARIARVVHEAIRAYQVAHGETPTEGWDEAEPWQRQVTIAGVRFRAAHPTATAQELHEAWASELRSLGWTLGPYKDARAKTHPSLVPFSELPVRERRKDDLFAAIVGALIEPAQGDRATRKPI